MKPKLSSHLILRINEELKNEISEIQKNSGCSISEIVRQCLVSIVENYKENNCIVLPVAVISKKELESLKNKLKKQSMQ